MILKLRAHIYIMFGGFDDTPIVSTPVVLTDARDDTIYFSAIKTPDHWDITWKSPTMSVALYDRFVKYFRETHDYGVLDRERIKEIIGFLELQNERFGTNAEMPAILSLRNIVIKDKIVKNYHRMNTKIRNIVREYNAGVDIVKLSFKWDFPPINLMRGIFLTKYNPTIVHAAFARTGDVETLDARDRAQLLRAQSHDAESFFNIDVATTNAATNERTLVEFFQRLGVAMETQDSLVAEQIAEHGRAVITPDILFSERVMINGQSVRWIEFKNYLGANMFLYKSNAAQVAKYYEKWGHGAICYSFGTVDNVSFPNTQILNASSLPINIITPLVEIQN